MRTLNFYKLMKSANRTLAMTALAVAVTASVACDAPNQEPTSTKTTYEEAMSPAAKEISHEHEKYGGWCHGHDLPEAYCTKCHPELAERYKAEGDWCEAHEFPESACPKCNPMTPPEGS